MIPYVGGKSYLANWIISNFPEDYTKLSYCEVFGGGGWVLFKKDESFQETYNDLNKDLVNLFRVIRDKYPEFEHRAEWSLHSREMYKEAVAKLKDDPFITEVEKAISYALYKIQTFSSGQSVSWGYSLRQEKIWSGRWLPFLRRMSIINARLKKVQIECMDFEKLIDKYDTKQTLFYLDPPYVGVEFYYKTNGVDFKASDHERLSEILKSIKGKFVLSYYEHELVRKLYKRYNIITKQAVKHSCGMVRNSKIKHRPKSIELLIKNY